MYRRVPVSIRIVACVGVVAGGAGLWVVIPPSNPVPSAAASPPPLASIHSTSGSPAQSSVAGRLPSAGQLLAGHPDPGQGYAIEADAQVLATIRRLLARSPDAALTWAAQTGDSAWHDSLVKLVYQVWSETDPAAAFDRARALEDGPQRDLAISGVLTGAAAQPMPALALAQTLFAEEPQHTADYGPYLLSAFSRSRQFSSALQLVAQAPAEFRAAWLADVVSSWAAQDPEAAAAALDAWPSQPDDPATLRDPAFRALFQAWAPAKAPALASLALSLPPGAARTMAYQQAMQQWSQQDPAGLANWLVTQPTQSPEFDSAVAALLQQTDQANRDTQTALQWSESIADPAIRYSATSHVLNEWLPQNPAIARDYVTKAPGLTPEQRTGLIEDLSLLP